MSVKYTAIKGAVRLLNVQSIMAKPYVELIKLFKTADAVPDIPQLSDPELEIETFEVNGQPVLWVRHKAPCGKALVYVVGGGMLKYPKPAQAKEQLRLAKETHRDIIMPYYPLAPQHNLLDVYDMLYATYKKLLEHYEAQNIAFLGGSSGGNHTLGLISHINAKAENLPMPGKVYVSSPGTMLKTTGEIKRAIKLDKTDLVMSVKALRQIFDGMTGTKPVPDYMRYLQCGDYTGLQSAYLCFGGDEVFAAAAPSIKKRMEECGVHVTLEIGAGLYHCYSAMPLVPEAQQGYQNMINYLL